MVEDIEGFKTQLDCRFLSGSPNGKFLKIDRSVLLIPGFLRYVRSPRPRLPISGMMNASGLINNPFGPFVGSPLRPVARRFGPGAGDPLIGVDAGDADAKLEWITADQRSDARNLPAVEQAA